MKVGYARISRGDDQTIRMQRDALRDAGCEKVYEETASGGRWDRPMLHRMLENLEESDVVVVWKLDRLSRSLRDLLVLLERFNEAGAGFLSLTEAIDTTTAGGRMMMQMLGAVAEFERAMISERTKAGIESARKRGHQPGRPSAHNALQREEIKRRVGSGEWSQAEAARLFDVDRSTICRLLKANLDFQ